MEAWLLAFDNDLAPIVGQQMTLNAAIGSQPKLREAVLQRIELMQTRAKAPWEAKECGGSKKHPVTECDLVIRGVVDNLQVVSLFHPATNTFLPIRVGDAVIDGMPDKHVELTTDQVIDLAETGKNSLTFTCMPPGSARRTN